jgi:hypothetical protein
LGIFLCVNEILAAKNLSGFLIEIRQQQMTRDARNGEHEQDR